MKKTISPDCPRECGRPAEIHSSLGILPCTICRDEDQKIKLKKPPRFATQSQSDRVQLEQDKHGKDVIQPWGSGNKPNEDFARAYPERAKDYFSDKELQSL